MLRGDRLAPHRCPSQPARRAASPRGRAGAADWQSQEWRQQGGRPSCGCFSAARDRRGVQTSHRRSPAAADGQWASGATLLPALCVRRLSARSSGARGITSRRRYIAQLDPYRRMIARAFFAANWAIDTRSNKPLCGFLAQQQMIDTKPSIARPPVTQVAPIGVHRIVRMKPSE